MANKDSKLEALKELENSVDSNLTQNNNTQNNIQKSNKPNSMDGFYAIDRYELPQNGILYPISWEFAYRCPLTKEVASLSTVNEQDQSAVMTAFEDIIKKCVIIFDTDRNCKISSGQILDSHRMWFILKLRELYLNNSPINFPSMCSVCTEKYDVNFSSSNLQFEELSEKLINSFDGRIFTLKLKSETPISFMVPTIETTSKLFKFMVKAYRENNEGKTNKQNQFIFDKTFLLVAPYLYLTGDESIHEINKKFIQISEDKIMLNDYLLIINKLNLQHKENISVSCPHCEALEEPQIKFPGGIKNLFITSDDDSGYFN